MHIRTQRRTAVLLVALCAGSTARGQTACIGDCGGDAVVSISDLMVGVRAVLDGRPAPDCVAWDPDGDQRVRVNDLVRGVASALAGPCRATPTPTSTPTVPADPLLALIQPAWVEACTRLGGPLYGNSRASPDGLDLSCMVGPGHDNHTALRRYGSADEAAAAFRDASGGVEPATLRDLPAVYEERPFVIGDPPLGGAYRTLVWQLGCWVATVVSFDDTSFRYAPDPFSFSEAILDVAREALLAHCDAEPTPTHTAAPTTTTPTPPDPLFAATRAPWEEACRGPMSRSSPSSHPELSPSEPLER